MGDPVRVEPVAQRKILGLPHRGVRRRRLALRQEPLFHRRRQRGREDPAIFRHARVSWGEDGFGHREGPLQRHRAVAHHVAIGLRGIPVWQDGIGQDPRKIIRVTVVVQRKGVVVRVQQDVGKVPAVPDKRKRVAD